jgi:RimJ/RimL family protein N-acetyltransferase
MAPPPAPVVFLAGQRVYLRPPHVDDAPRYVRWLNDEQVRQWVTFYLPMPEHAEREWIEAAPARRDEVHFALVLRAGDRHIGGLGLHQIRWKDRAATFGIFIGEPDCWGQGYGAEATRLLLRYAFATLNLNRVELGVFAFNKRAIRVYEKLGFVREGVRREWAFINGRYTDEVAYSILAREYLASTPAAEQPTS